MYGVIPSFLDDVSQRRLYGSTRLVTLCIDVAWGSVYFSFPLERPTNMHLYKSIILLIVALLSASIQVGATPFTPLFYLGALNTNITAGQQNRYMRVLESLTPILGSSLL
jgi:prepilin signal peptidase PulO-like enzyme (type II secretory pathway)